MCCRALEERVNKDVSSSNVGKRLCRQARSNTRDPVTGVQRVGALRCGAAEELVDKEESPSNAAKRPRK